MLFFLFGAQAFRLLLIIVVPAPKRRIATELGVTYFYCCACFGIIVGCFKLSLAIVGYWFQASSSLSQNYFPESYPLHNQVDKLLRIASLPIAMMI